MESAPPPNQFGLILFCVYSIAYTAYVAVAAFATFDSGLPVGGLAAEAYWGLNWGVVGGFGLIFGAFLLALAYAIVRVRIASGRGEDEA
jgi:hypothetical protein